jgi:hypothetical protein
VVDSLSFPQAKVVVVERDIDKWYKSFDEAIITPSFSTAANIMHYIVEPILGTRGSIAMRKALLGYFRATGPEEFRKNAKPIYREHYERIRKTVPKDRLLNYELGSGWEPLCTFLEKPVPNADFPWVNETAALQKKIKEFQAQMVRGAWNKLKPIVLVGGAVSLAYVSKAYLL